MATIAEIIEIKYPDEYKNNKIYPIQGESFNSSFTSVDKNNSSMV